MKNKIAIIACLILTTISIHSQDFRLPIYKGTPPGFKDNGGKEQVINEDIILISHVQTPDIAVYLPSKKMATGQAVIICPGGGYHILAYDY
ncbi:MAG TPA: hypothetical protein PL123_13520, partial [Bacteroidales bacterium]|nr:hypothetical protein [Bacteroidales bacterium]